MIKYNYNDLPRKTKKALKKAQWKSMQPTSSKRKSLDIYTVWRISNNLERVELHPKTVFYKSFFVGHISFI